MGYKFNPYCLGEAFMVPARVVDKHIKLAGATQLKALLWIMRHLTDKIDIDKLSAAIGQKRADTVDALHYWVENGVLIDDESVSEQIGASSGKETSSPDTMETKAPNDRPPALTPAHESAVKKTLADLPESKPTSEQIIARANEAADIRFLFKEAQSKMGRTIGYEGQCMLLMMHDQYGLPVEVILMIIEYCVSVGKVSNSYIAKIGKDWGEREIDTIEKADDQISRLRTGDKLWREFSSLAGLVNSRPTPKQMPYIKCWGTELGFDAEMIYLAYEQMANHCKNFSLSYIDKVLKAWHTAGIKTPADVEQAESARAAKNDNKPKSKNASYDLDELKRHAAYDPIVYKGGKK